MSKKSTALILIIILTSLISGCGLLLEFENLRHREPTQYYLFAPPNYTGESNWPAFIYVGGFGQTGRDCLRTWMQYAEEYEFILVCPVLAGADGGWIQGDGEEKVVAILGAVAEEYKINSKSFVVGFSAGAQFMIGYTFSYPNFVSGASIISTGNAYPIRSSARRVPFLITIGDQDPNRLNLARDFNIELVEAGFSSTHYILEGIGHEVSPTAINLTLQHFQRATP